MKTRVCGKLFNAEVQTLVLDQRYLVQIEATPRTAAFVFALGFPATHIAPAEDSGRAWYQIEWSAQVDATMIHLIEIAATLREHEPNFNQLELAL